MMPFWVNLSVLVGVLVSRPKVPKPQTLSPQTSQRIYLRPGHRSENREQKHLRRDGENFRVLALSLCRFRDRLRTFRASSFGVMVWRQQAG